MGFLEVAGNYSPKLALCALAQLSQLALFNEGFYRVLGGKPESNQWQPIVDRL